MRNVSRETIWADSSVGRALHSHCRGQGFDSPSVHQTKIPLLKRDFCFERMFHVKQFVASASVFISIVTPFIFPPLSSFDSFFTLIEIVSRETIEIGFPYLYL
jgi:hypothetical protein